MQAAETEEWSSDTTSTILRSRTSSPDQSPSPQTDLRGVQQDGTVSPLVREDPPPVAQLSMPPSIRLHLASTRTESCSPVKHIDTVSTDDPGAKGQRDELPDLGWPLRTSSPSDREVNQETTIRNRTTDSAKTSTTRMAVLRGVLDSALRRTSSQKSGTAHG